jgi:hypothetical protein
MYYYNKYMWHKKYIKNDIKKNNSKHSRCKFIYLYFIDNIKHLSNLMICRKDLSWGTATCVLRAQKKMMTSSCNVVSLVL